MRPECSRWWGSSFSFRWFATVSENHRGCGATWRGGREAGSWRLDARSLLHSTITGQARHQTVLGVGAEMPPTPHKQGSGKGRGLGLSNPSPREATPERIRKIS